MRLERAQECVEHVHCQAGLIRERKLSPVELVRGYLDEVGAA